MPPAEIMGNEIGSLLKWTLRVYAIIGIVYGAIFLLIPGQYIAFSGAEPVAFGWLRWPGGMLAGFAFGVLLLSRNPFKQGLFVTTTALIASMIGLSLLYTMITGEYTMRFSSILVAATINLVCGTLMWVGLSQNREAL